MKHESKTKTTLIKKQKSLQRIVRGNERTIKKRKRKSFEKRKTILSNGGVLDKIIEGCVLIGYDWKYLYVNESAAQHRLQKPEDMIGKSMLECYPGIEKSEVFTCYKRCMEERIPQQFESQFSFANETGNWYLVSVQPVTEGIFVISFDITERKLTEVKLKKAERLSNEAQRLARLGNWELDLEKNVLHWSDEIYRIFEIDREKFGASYDAFLNAIHPDDREAVNVAYTNSVKNKTPYSIDHRLLFPDGRIKFVHEECQTFYDKKEKPIRSVGTVQDITDRKMFEQAIARLNRVYKVLSETNQLIVREKNRKRLLETICRIAVEDGKLLMASVAFVDYKTQKVVPFVWYGKEEGYFSSITLSTEKTAQRRGPTVTAIRENRPVFSTDIASEPVMLPWREEALKRGYRSSASFPLVEDNKAVGAFSVYAGETNFFNEKELKLLDEMAMDISFALGNLKAEEMLNLTLKELQESEERFTAFMNNSPAVAWLKDPTTWTFSYINNAFEKIFNITRDVISKKTDFDLWPEEVARQLRENDLKIMSSDKTIETFEDVPLPDGTLRHWLVFKFPLLTPSGKRFLAGTAIDITERKRAENELIEAKERAEKSDRLKTEFLQQMSHEIRSPMNAVIGLSNLIKEEVYDKVAPDILEYFEGIDSAGKRLIRTVNLILDTSVMHVGMYEPAFTEIDIFEEVLKHLKVEFSSSAAEKGLEFLLSNNVSKPLVICDKYSVTQIFGNLVDNAIKYTQHGNVEISVDKDPASNVTVTVEDTGIGISKEFMKKLFEPFTQEESGYSRRFEGNGLGLALAKKYSDINKANISVESEKGKGSKFTITFLK